MQEEQQHQPAALTDHEEDLAKDPAMAERPRVDWYLQLLVNMANERGVEMGITLVCGGSVVSGTLISGATYFESFADAFTSAWPTEDEGRNTMRDALSRPASMYGAGKSDALGPSFIHLKNARVCTPSGSAPNPGMLWRGRLTEVSGFSLGSIG
ncbi:gas vesicle protein [Paraburkholderia sp. CNPSo 3076]|uniref:gas vesicle accessory protein GvpU n=1 Tax=Paraburkholderia sp. CNPSo 3076 TaxID=2940936 RepID=UPI00225549F6|nr:gas vesicle accessory protein GvpU [Paraburkholderia sp. CNPSo 3076]MCX5542594.1 gas vesicle protein [Paraburkholderia sp. CNPSo 3076]